MHPCSYACGEAEGADSVCAPVAHTHARGMYPPTTMHGCVNAFRTLLPGRGVGRSLRDARRPAACIYPGTW